MEVPKQPVKRVRTGDFGGGDVGHLGSLHMISVLIFVYEVVIIIVSLTIGISHLVSSPKASSRFPYVVLGFCALVTFSFVTVITLVLVETAILETKKGWF